MINFFIQLSPPRTWSSSEYSARGPKISLSSCVRSACRFQIPGGAWIIGRSLRVRHGPWRLHTTFRKKRDVKGKRGEQRKSVSTRISRDPLASGPAKARGPDLWMGPDPRGGRRWRLAEPGTTLASGSTNRRLVSPLSSRLFLPLALSFSFSFLLLAQLLIWIPHHLPLLFLLFNFFLFSRLSLLPKTLWPSSLVFYSEPTSRQLCVDDCPGIIAGKLGGCRCRCDFFFSIKFQLHWIEEVVICFWKNNAIFVIKSL